MNRAVKLILLRVEYNKELMTPIGRPMALSDGRVIEELLKKS